MRNYWAFWEAIGACWGLLSPVKGAPIHRVSYPNVPILHPNYGHGNPK